MPETIEAAVIGAALSEIPGLWLEHATSMHAGLFDAHKELAAEVCAMSATKSSTDPQSVYAWLVERKITRYKLSDLMALSNNAPLSPESMTAAVNALKEIAKTKSIKQLASNMLTHANKRGVKANEILTSAFAALNDISKQSSTGLERMSSIVKIVYDNLDKPLATSVKTGFSKLDNITGGLRPGQLVILGARPSMGKTAMALGIAQNAALDGKTVAIFSLEMSREEVCQRFLANMSGVNLARIVSRHLAKTDFERISLSADKLHQAKIFISDTADQLGPACQQLQHSHGLNLVVIDYLQLMDSKGESREQAIASLSRRLKQLARQLGVAIVVLSQLNRQVEQRVDKRPRLSDLRESGSIEQDADLCLLLWRPGYYDEDSDQSLAELDVAKNRNGPTGTIKLNWQSDCAKFGDRIWAAKDV